MPQRPSLPRSSASVVVPPPPAALGLPKVERVDFSLQQFVIAADAPPSAPMIAAAASTFGSDVEDQTRLFSAAVDVPAGLGYWVVQVRVDGVVDPASIFGLEVVQPVCPSGRHYPNAEGVCVCRSPFEPRGAECIARAEPVPIGVIVGPVLAGVFVLIVVAVVGASWYERNMWGRGWRIEMKVLDTTDCQVLGQGSNGYVVSAMYRGTRVALKRGLAPDMGDNSNAPLLGEKGRRIVRKARKERERSVKQEAEKADRNRGGGAEVDSSVRGGRMRGRTDSLPTIDESTHNATSSRGTTHGSSSVGGQRLASAPEARTHSHPCFRASPQPLPPPLSAQRRLPLPVSLR